MTRCIDKIGRIFHNCDCNKNFSRYWITSLPPTVAPGISDTGRTLNSTRLLPLKDFCIYETKVNIGGGSGLHNDWRRGRGKRRMAQVRPVVCSSFFNLHLLCFGLSRMWIHQSFQLNMHLDMFNMSPGTSAICSTCHQVQVGRTAWGSSLPA